MAQKLSQHDVDERRNSILQGARWCFLNFGFSKTSLDDIARRANISRTLLYKTFKDKEDIFAAVFESWLVARQPAALEAARGKGNGFDRLMTVCRLLVVDPWVDMAGAPMAAEFYDVCDRLDPELSAHHRQVVLECVSTILKDEAAGEVFVLALDGMLVDQPAPDALDQRIGLLAERFLRPKGAKG